VIRGFQGKMPKIAETAFVSEAAYVVGEVEIGEFSGVWPGAIVRGDFAPIVIGKYTNIEDNCVIHCASPLSIGDEVIVGHGAVVHGRKVGSHVLIGNQATVLDEVEIGNYCVIAAGSLVPPGMIVPDYSLVMGVPARVKGRLSDAQIEEIKTSVKFYVDLVQKYKREGLG